MDFNKEIIRMICRRSGMEMNRSADFDTLSLDINRVTGQHLSVNTLKRMFGFNATQVTPRLSTLDIIAAYLGFTSYDALIHMLGPQSDISLFSPVECIDVDGLRKGTQVRLAYDPNRLFLLTYIGGCQFIVNEAIGSHNVRKGDVLTITQLAVGHRLVASHVVRDGADLGAYESAKLQGLHSIEII